MVNEKHKGLFGQLKILIAFYLNFAIFVGNSDADYGWRNVVI